MAAEVCKTDDDFVRFLPRWVAVLSNGETIYQDDDRPGVEEPSAWKRLKSYCSETGAHIRELWLQFRSNRVCIQPTDADGYYFVKCAYGFWGATETKHAYIAGALVDGSIHAIKWRVPELLSLEVQTREPDYLSPSLITKQSKSS